MFLKPSFHCRVWTLPQRGCKMPLTPLQRRRPTCCDLLLELQSRCSRYNQLCEVFLISCLPKFTVVVGLIVYMPAWRMRGARCTSRQSVFCILVRDAVRNDSVAIATSWYRAQQPPVTSTVPPPQSDSQPTDSDHHDPGCVPIVFEFSGCSGGCCISLLAISCFYSVLVFCTLPLWRANSTGHLPRGWPIPWHSLTTNHLWKETTSSVGSVLCWCRGVLATTG